MPSGTQVNGYIWCRLPIFCIRSSSRLPVVPQKAVGSLSQWIV